MRKFLSGLILLVAICHGLAGCSESTTPEITGEIGISLSLQPAADLGYEVSRVVATASGSGLTRQGNLTIDGTRASGVIDNLPPGPYEVTVEAHVGQPVVASGTGTMTAGTGEESVDITFVDWESLYPELPRSILFIGNSLTLFNGGLDLHFAALTEGIDTNLVVITGMVARGGATLQELWDADNQAAVLAIETGEWDMVVVQPSPGNIIFPRDDFSIAVRRFASLARRNGGELALIAPHTYTDYPDEAGNIARAVRSAARQVEARVLPMNQTWTAVQEEQPDLQLYSDQIHQTAVGTYLYLCVAYAGLLESSPEGREYVNHETIGDADRDYIQSVSWRTAGIHMGWNADEP